MLKFDSAYIELLFIEKFLEQAGTELGQAQLQRQLGFTLIKVCCIT